MAASLPRILVLGGCGFIGRHLVQHVVTNGLASVVRVADKVLPDLAGMSATQLEIFKGELVECVQANLARPVMVEKAFAGDPFDVVVNLAGETKLSQTAEVYKENVVDIVTACGAKAKETGVRKWIEVSTAQVYDADGKASDESGKLKPWTKLAQARYQAEQALRGLGIPLVILRASNVYGPGDQRSVMPRVITAAVYQKLNEKMDFLWEKSLQMHTVHVLDVVRAIVHCINTAEPGALFNLSDTGETNQGTIAALLEPIFGIKTNFMGNLKSKMATSIAMKQVCEAVNEKHLKPWSDLCKEAGITTTPLTPYLDEELLYKNPLAVDGRAITQTGFEYQHPALSEAHLREMIDYFRDLGFFPEGITK